MNNEFKFDSDLAICIEDIKVSQLIELLKTYPEDSRIFCEGFDRFFIHSNTDKDMVALDTDACMENYDKDPFEYDGKAIKVYSRDNIDHEIDRRKK